MQSKWKLVLIVAATAATVAAMAAAQGLSPGEVKVGSQAWRPAAPLFVTNAENVTVDVVVRTSDGKSIAGLGQRQFRVLDDGHPRTISGFSEIDRQAQPAVTTAAAGGLPAPAQTTPAAPARYIAVFFDDANTDKKDLMNARIAAERFVREGLGPGDQVALFTASSTVSLDFTHNQAKLLAALAKLAPHPRTSSGSIDVCPRITPYQAYLIVSDTDPMALSGAVQEKQACDVQNGVVDDLTGKPVAAFNGYSEDLNYVKAQADATWEPVYAESEDTLASIAGVERYLARRPGTRILLLASGGFFTGGLEQRIEDLGDVAVRDRVVISALDAKGMYTEDAGRPIDEVSQLPELPLAAFEFDEISKFPQELAEDETMLDLAESTGGLFFHDNNDLMLGFRRIGLAPEASYTLSFVINDVPHNGKLHTLKVKLASPPKNVIVQARTGYYAPAPEPAAADPMQRIDAAMQSQAAEADAPATISVSPARGQEPGVAVEFRIDAARLAFDNQHGRRNQRLIFVAALYGANGRFIAGKQATMALALKPATWQRFRAQGIGGTLTLSAPAGFYTLRALTLTADGKMSVINQPVSIR